ncbi:MAG: hypothetical protein AB7N65_22355, partial [Vicinamibacterales bacterium]
CRPTGDQQQDNRSEHLTHEHRSLLAGTHIDPQTHAYGAHHIGGLKTGERVDQPIDVALERDPEIEEGTLRVSLTCRSSA